MKTQIILFGAGEMGRRALAYLRSRGIEPVAFADSNQERWYTDVDGVIVLSPGTARGTYPHSHWVATVLSLPASQEVPELMHKLGVNTLPLWSVMPPPDGRGKCAAYYGRLPDQKGFESLLSLVADDTSRAVAQDQYDFYSAPDYDVLSIQEPIANIYFPDFITRLETESFVDCGAADGDSITQFLAKWPVYSSIMAIEPDNRNFEKLLARHRSRSGMTLICGAVSDETKKKSFLSTGDYCSRLGTDGLANAECHEVACFTLDFLCCDKLPTFIKMDIEGSELDALNGARSTIQRSSPVLAICGYHTVDHFWQVPALIHEIRPDYKLFLRRYAPAPFELIVYGVPESRIAE